MGGDASQMALTQTCTGAFPQAAVLSVRPRCPDGIPGGRHRVAVVLRAGRHRPTTATNGCGPEAMPRFRPPCALAEALRAEGETATALVRVPAGRDDGLGSRCQADTCWPLRARRTTYGGCRALAPAMPRRTPWCACSHAHGTTTLLPIRPCRFWHCARSSCRQPAAATSRADIPP